jgi:hypothetical protein
MSRGKGSRATTIIRGWRWPALVVAGVLAAAAIVALLQPRQTGYLDPGGTDPAGGHALSDIMASRGQVVIRTALPPSTGSAGSLELVTSPDLLTSAQLAQAGRFGGDILLIDPDLAALHAIAPAISIAGQSSGTFSQPACVGPAAVAGIPALGTDAGLAGDAYISGAVLTTGDPRAQLCYLGNGGYFLVRYASRGRTISVLGGGAPLTNQYLAQEGDAALALNLVRADSRVYWVMPSGTPPPPPGTASGQRPFLSLVPWPAYLIAIQLAVALLLAAAWRARRLGPLVAERIPVVVRASETVEGHGRLYQSRRARDRAAAELRAAAVNRITRRTGGSFTAETIAARTGQAPEEVANLLHGPPPASDPALVSLAANLDTLERKIRQS